MMMDTQDSKDSKNSDRIEGNIQQIQELKHEVPFLFRSFSDNDLGQILYSEFNDYYDVRKTVIFSPEGFIEMNGSIGLSSENVLECIHKVRDDLSEDEIDEKMIHSICIEGRFGLYSPWGMDTFFRNDKRAKSDFLFKLNIFAIKRIWSVYI